MTAHSCPHIGNLCEDSAVRSTDFYIEELLEADPSFGVPGPTKRANEDLLNELRLRSLADKSDVEVAVALTRLVHDELQAYGTGGLAVAVSTAVAHEVQSTPICKCID